MTEAVREGTSSDHARGETREELRRDRDFALAELARLYGEVRCLYDLDAGLEAEFDPIAVLARTVELLRSMFSVERAEIWIASSGETVYRCLVRHDGTSTAEGSATVLRTALCDHILRTMGTFVLADAGSAAPPLARLVLALAGGLGLPVIALPLKTRDALLGVLLFKLRDGATPLRPAELDLLGAVARKLSVALHVRCLMEQVRADEGIRRELEIARNIQRRLLPREVPRHDRLDIHAGCITAADVGGDYYDFFETPAGLGLLIADAAGHSVSSALVGMGFRSAFRHHLQAGIELDELFRAVNATMYQDLYRSGSFLSAFSSVISHTGSSLRYVNAGHSRPFLFRSRLGESVVLDGAGLILGVLRDAPYAVEEVPLEPGDVLVSYTDGLTEATNQHGELFGEERLEAALNRYATRSAVNLYHSLLREVYQFQDRHFNRDDITLAVIKVKPEPAARVQGCI